MGAKILVVASDTENMARLEMSLSPRGHEVVLCNKLSDAQTVLDNDTTIDLIICDLIFPVGDSFDLLKEVRADHAQGDMPFIFLVEAESLLTDNLRKAAAILGADKFIFMDNFDAHRVRCEIEALLPEQTTGSMPPAITQPEDREIGT
ncbi:MAG TPA: response regulator [Candidatus Obscuribacterales bacterium]